MELAANNHKIKNQFLKPQWNIWAITVRFIYLLLNWEQLVHFPHFQPCRKEKPYKMFWV